MNKTLPSPNPPEKRIYCVVANTVQAPLDRVTVRSKFAEEKLVPTGETKTTLQPAGRLMAQQGHVVSKVRDIMLKQHVKKIWNTLCADSLLWDWYCDPITTINLAVRDSFELNHVFQLLNVAGIAVHDFYDTDQPDYGSADLEVRTAIATEPVTAVEVLGILDYLPLWKPNPWDVVV